MNNAPTPVEIPNLLHASAFVEGVPHDVFDHIRSQPGLFWHPLAKNTEHGGVWILTRTKDIAEVDSDAERFSSAQGISQPMMMLPPDNPIADMLITMDPPKHSRVRRVVARAFGPRVVANFDPWIREIVTETLDGLVASEGVIDYIPTVAAPIPCRVVARILGVPKADEPFIVKVTNTIFIAAQDIDNQEEASKVQAEALSGLFDYVENVLMPLKREHPADDMSTVLTQGYDAGEISRGEALFLHQMIMNAGFETTHTTIGQIMRMMVEDAEIEETTLRAVEEIGTGPVVDEYLRYLSPAMGFMRTATIETEVAGQRIRKGDQLAMFFTAANRDPNTFTDPHTFNPWRNEPGMLTFGTGPHRCIGAPVARLELQILFEEMVRRNIRLRLAGTPKRGYSNFVNTLAELPVEIVSGV
ncbi:cytochrome P450 [Rhodococcus koreensis]